MDGEIIHRVWDQMIARFDGPMHFRLIMQPLVAAVLAIRDGMQDAREGWPPWLKTVVTNPGLRGKLVLHAWKSLSRIIIIALIMDTIYQIWQLHYFYIGEALLTAFVCALLPYALVRGPANGIARRLVKK